MSICADYDYELNWLWLWVKNKCFAVLSFIKLSNLDHFKNQILSFKNNFKLLESRFLNQFDTILEDNFFLSFGKKNQKGNLIKKINFFFYFP